MTAYVASKALVLGALTTLQCATLAAIALARQGSHDGGSVVSSACSSWCSSRCSTGLAAMGLGLLISALASTVDRAMTVLPVVLIFQMLLAMGGVFPDVVEKPGLEQASYLAGAQWGFSSAASTVDLDRLQSVDRIARKAPTVNLQTPLARFEPVAADLETQRALETRARALGRPTPRRCSSSQPPGSAEPRPPWPAGDAWHDDRQKGSVTFWSDRCSRWRSPAAAPRPRSCPRVDGGGARWQAIEFALPAKADPRSPNVCGSGAPACIDEVTREMQRRLDLLAARCDHNAAFALMYLRVTERAGGTEATRFDDTRYLNHLDAVFARLYFRALDDWRGGRRDQVPEAWRLAFATADEREVRGPRRHAARHERPHLPRPPLRARRRRPRGARRRQRRGRLQPRQRAARGRAGADDLRGGAALRPDDPQRVDPADARHLAPRSPS